MIYLNATNFNREWKKPIFKNKVRVSILFLLHSSDIRPVNGEGYSEWFKRDQNISRTLSNLESENYVYLLVQSQSSQGIYVQIQDRKSMIP